MKYIDKKVLIKEAPGSNQDRIYVVRGLPQDLLFHEDGKSPLSGIEISQTGDGGYVFDTNSREGKERLVRLDQYVGSVYPRTKVLPKRVVNAQIVGDSRSNPLTAQELESRMTQLYGVPFVDLPIPESAPTLKAESSAEVIAKTFTGDEFAKSDSPLNVNEPATEKDFEKQEERTKYACVDKSCNYKTDNYRAFRMHNMKKHKKVLKRGEYATVSSP